MTPRRTSQTGQRGAAACIAALLLAGCAVPQAPLPCPAPLAPGTRPDTPPLMPPPTQPNTQPDTQPALPPAGPTADPFAALFAGRAAGPVLRIADDALIAVTVRRGGALARLGHDHVVAARRIDGHVDPTAGLAVLRFRLDQMTVDEAALRDEAGLAKQPSADAIAGTRANMLTKVLDAARYPLVEVRVRRTDTPGLLRADITLHGTTRPYAVPVTVAPDAQGLVARGTLALKQTDFGITPFSVLGGALAVQDALEIRFVLPARPAAPDAVR